MELFKDIFITSYFGVVFWIAFGIFFLKSWSKKKDKDSLHKDTERITYNLKGVGAGIAGITLGIMILIGKILGKI